MVCQCGLLWCASVDSYGVPVWTLMVCQWTLMETVAYKYLNNDKSMQINHACIVSHIVVWYACNLE